MKDTIKSKSVPTQKILVYRRRPGRYVHTLMAQVNVRTDMQEAYALHSLGITAFRHPGQAVNELTGPGGIQYMLLVDRTKAPTADE